MEKKFMFDPGKWFWAFAVALLYIVLVGNSCVSAQDMEFCGDSIQWVTSGTTAVSSTRYQPIGWTFSVYTKNSSGVQKNSHTYYLGTAVAQGYNKSKGIERTTEKDGKTTISNYSLSTSQLIKDTGIDIREGTTTITANAIIEIYNGKKSYGVYKTKAEANAAVRKYGFRSDFDGSYVGYFAQNVSINYYSVRTKKSAGISSVSPEEQWVKKGLDAKITAKVGKGYKWKEWNYTNYKDDSTGACGKKDPAYTVKKIGGNWLFKAEAVPIQYKIVYEKNGADKGKMGSQKLEYDQKEKLSKNRFARKGYIFTGWNTKKNGGGTDYKNQASVKNLSSVDGKEITLYAQWKPITYTICFQGNGADKGGMSEEKMTYNVSKRLTKNSFTRTGYSFAGWNTKKDGKGTGYQDQASVKNLDSTQGEKIILYAQWKPITYTICFDGSGADKGVMSNEKMTYNVSAPLTKNSFTRTGYSFVNWNTEKDGKGTNYNNQASVKNLTSVEGKKITLYAQWKPITYTICFDGNGADKGVMPEEDMTYNVSKPLRKNSFARTGFTFANWNTRKDGKGDSYRNQVYVKNMTSVQGKKITLYAQWKQLPGYGSGSGADPDPDSTPDPDPDPTPDPDPNPDPTPDPDPDPDPDLDPDPDPDHEPWIEAEDRYFSLEDAKAGRITEEELFAKAEAADEEDGRIERGIHADNSFVLVNYSEEEFTRLEADAVVTETYRAADSAGNFVTKEIRVHVTETKSVADPAGKNSLRFISLAYLDASEEMGGLCINSVWRTSEWYHCLKEALKKLS